MPTNQILFFDKGFARHTGLRIVKCEPGFSQTIMELLPHVFNPHGVVHGGALFTLADTGMGVALYPTLKPNEICATIEMKISFLKSVKTGPIECSSQLLARGKNVAYLEAKITVAGILMAKASSSYAIIQQGKSLPRQAHPGSSDL